MRLIGTDVVTNQPRESVDLDVAGTGLDADCGTAAADFSGDVMFIERSLHLHFVVGVDVSRTSGSVENEAAAARPKFNVPGAGFELPIACDRTGDFDIA